MVETLSPLAAADEDFIAIHRTCGDSQARTPELLDLAEFLNSDWLGELFRWLTEDLLELDATWSSLMRHPAALVVFKCSEPAKTNKRLSEVIKTELKNLDRSLCGYFLKARVKNASGNEDIQLAMDILEAAAEVKRHEGEHALPRYLKPDHTIAVERAIAAIENGCLNKRPSTLLSCIEIIARVYPGRGRAILRNLWWSTIRAAVVAQGLSFKTNGLQAKDEMLLVVNPEYLVELQQVADVDKDLAASIVEPEDWTVLNRMLAQCRGRCDTSLMHRRQQIFVLKFMRALQPLYAKFFPKP